VQISPCISSCENEQDIEDKLLMNLSIKYSQETAGSKGISETGITVEHEGKLGTVTVRTQR
jgi:hypothetical protein